MTRNSDLPEKAGKSPARPNASISVEHLAGIRVRPAQFATMMGVSRQTVSEWKRKGWITLGPDGKLDPAKAARQAYSNMDPLRTRAHVMRDAVEERSSLEEQVAELRAELDASRRNPLAKLPAILDAGQVEIAAVFLFDEFTHDPLHALDMADAALWALWNAWSLAAPPCIPVGKLPLARVDIAPQELSNLLTSIEARRQFWMCDSEGAADLGESEPLADL